MANDALERGFGLSTSTDVVVASMVGTGILISPGFMMMSLGNYPVIFGLWALGGVLALAFSDPRVQCEVNVIQCCN